jgi:uncharacterized protein (TIGR02466 family)
MSQVIGLFATPLVRVPALVDAAMVGALCARFAPAAGIANAHSGALSHTAILTPQADPLLLAIQDRIAPELAALGALLFGESLDWSIKEMWVNVLETGGQQALHNHANCFISGVLYLTDCDASANTVFSKGTGGRDFVFRNAHAGTASGPFSADRWVAPDPAPGDLLLFPSYLLHEVPVNCGQRRISLAFNVIPARLDSWGYGIGFSTPTPTPATASGRTQP